MTDHLKYCAVIWITDSFKTLELMYTQILMTDMFWMLEIIVGPKAETYTFNNMKEL